MQINENSLIPSKLCSLSAVVAVVALVHVFVNSYVELYYSLQVTVLMCGHQTLQNKNG